jgi:hypothetical protein
VELPTGFVNARAAGFQIITRPVYYKLAVSVAEQDPENLLSRAASASGNGGAGDEGAADPPLSGRGRIVELPGEGGETLILKKNRRGGLYGKIMGDVHRSDYQALNEVFLSETAWKKGVPVALVGFVMSAPAGEGRQASYRRGYTATIKVEGAHRLGELLVSATGAKRRNVIRSAADAIKRAHGRGFQHGDLNLGNVLIVRSDHGDYNAWLIDLAHSRLGGSLPFKRRLDNLVRLYRSAEKWMPARTTAHRRQRVRDIVHFLRVYTDGDAQEVRRFMVAAERYRKSLLMHRLGWKIGRATRRNIKSPSAPADR